MSNMNQNPDPRQHREPYQSSGQGMSSGLHRSWGPGDIRGAGTQPQARFGAPTASPGPAAGPHQRQFHGGQPGRPGQAVPPRRRPRRLAGPIAALTMIVALLGGGVGALAVRGLGDGQDASTTTTRLVQSDGANPDWTQTAEVASKSVVSIKVASGRGEAEGSGVILDAQGHIVTNNHVVASAGTGAQIQVTTADQKVYSATIVGSDPSTDLAVLRLQDAPNDLTPATFADSTRLKVGQPVMAIGNPLGLSETVTTGIVSALDRPVTTQSESNQATVAAQRSELAVTNAIQTSAAINPGNSGGALVNANGELVGITSSIASLGSSSGGQSGNIGIGFAIPADDVSAVAKQLVESGTAQHAWLGVTTQDQAARTSDGTYVGAGVASVADGSPAASAGLRSGDVITKLGQDNAITGSESLMAAVRGHQVGDKITLTVIRDGQSQTIDVTLANAPQ